MSYKCQSCKDKDALIISLRDEINHSNHAKTAAVREANELRVVNMGLIQQQVG